MTQRYVPKPIIPANGDTVFRYTIHPFRFPRLSFVLRFPLRRKPRKSYANVVCRSLSRNRFTRSLNYSVCRFFFVPSSKKSGIFVEKNDLRTEDFSMRLQRLSDVIIDIVVLYWFLSFIHKIISNEVFQR